MLEHLLRIGRRAIVSFPNFGHWRVRVELAVRGRMPVTENLPYSWYDTPNIHFCTIRDFVALCREVGARMERAVALDAGGRPMRVNAALVGLEPVRRAGGVPAAAGVNRARLRPVRQRMQVAHHALQPLVEHVGVDLRRRDVGMAEQLLHDAQVGAVLQEVAGEGVAQHVRADAVGPQRRRRPPRP